MKKLFASLAVIATLMFSVANVNAANVANFEPTTSTEMAAIPAAETVDVYIFIFDDGTVIVVVVVY